MPINDFKTETSINIATPCTYITEESLLRLVIVDLTVFIDQKQQSRFPSTVLELAAPSPPGSREEAALEAEDVVRERGALNTRHTLDERDG